MTTLADNVSELRHLVKTDPDPRVRHRAQAWLMLAQGASVLGVARWFQTAPQRVRVWRTWFLEGGRDRLADDRRTGRPPKLGPADLTFLDEALQQGPQAYGWPVTTWSIRACRSCSVKSGTSRSASTPSIAPCAGSATAIAVRGTT
jgi:hypothetical protein